MRSMDKYLVPFLFFSCFWIGMLYGRATPTFVAHLPVSAHDELERCIVVAENAYGLIEWVFNISEGASVDAATVPALVQAEP